MHVAPPIVKSKVHVEPREFTLYALYSQLTMMLLHNPEAHRESQSSPLISRFGREEWIKDTLRQGLGDSGSMIFHGCSNPAFSTTIEPPLSRVVVS